MRVFLLSSKLDSPLDSTTIYTLSKKEIQYLTRVLRLEVGTEFTTKDKNEQYYKATLINNESIQLVPTDNPEATLLDKLSTFSEPFADITAYISILKGKKNETVVRALTEIGVKRIAFVQSQFVQEKELSGHQWDRLDIIAKEAVQQSGAKAPILTKPMPFIEAIKESSGTILFLHQSPFVDSKSLFEAVNSLDTKEKISCFIGPEGGFSDEECQIAIDNGAIPILLKTNILRAETASIYAVSAIQTILHR